MSMMKSYADDDYSFGMRLIPPKLIENSDGILQVYALHNNHIYPQKIENMAISSTDTSIVQIIGTENSNNSFITNIKLKTSGHGNVKIELGAPGFSSKEVPIMIYENANYPVKLLVQSTPSTFSINGPHLGYFTVELTNNAGSPVTTKDSILIGLTTTNNRVLTLTDTHILIKAGEYYGIGRFEVKQVGSAQIFSSADSLQSAGAVITVIQTGSPTIHTYVYPQKINNYQSSISYVIAQLTDSSGALTPAGKDITIPVNVVDPNANLTNSSPIIQNIESNVPITIKKDSYWGYTNLSVKAEATGIYNVFTSAPNGYVNAGQSTVNATISNFYDDKSARLDVLPILATGKEELIGVLHLEDPNGNPIIASHDLQIEIDSSDANALTVDKVNMNKGDGVALVFGKVGTSIPSSLSLHVITYHDQIVTPSITLPTSNLLNLVIQPLVPKILSHSTFPVAVYLTDPSGAPTYFSSDAVLNVLSNDYFSFDQDIIHNGDSIILVNSTSLKEGNSKINFILSNYQTAINLGTVDTSPSQVMLDYPNPTLSNLPNTIVVQIFDSNSNPVFAQKDINLRLISSNNTVLTLPENITISKGKYYALLNVQPNAVGISQISILANDLPLSISGITVESLFPTLNIIMPNSALPGETFFASVRVQDHGDPLKNMNIKWKVNGAIIQNSDSVTNSDGTANIVLLPNSVTSVSLDINASGFGYMSEHVSKIVRINGSGTNPITSSILPSGELQGNLKSFKINGVDPVPIITLGVIAIGGILVKKKKLLGLKK